MEVAELYNMCGCKYAIRVKVSLILRVGIKTALGADTIKAKQSCVTFVKYIFIPQDTHIVDTVRINLGQASVRASTQRMDT